MIFIEKATPELFAAIAKAQAQVENAAKSSSNPHFKSCYADLAEVLNTVRPVFAANGLSITQSTGFDGTLVVVTTLVGHSSGGMIHSTAACVPSKTDAQGIGSATTYLRRYSLAAMCGVAQEDDDGNAEAHDAKAEAHDAKAEPFYDASQWLSAIADAATKDDLDRTAGELKAQEGIPPTVMAKIRAAYSAKAKAMPS